MRNFLKDLPHYLLLFAILIAGFAGLILFSYNRGYQVAIAFGLMAAYVIWGLVHHSIHKDLYFETFVEYFAIAVLGFVIIFSLVIRG